ncbi:hypothetical protein MRS76_12940 [Rhizobiaceae bacterium n13]|uniref:Uncharacterized protein n=1 Tax=Ferirhizobium litorale TaxID=2927786 RepID=A0AAE3U2C0_9HYPH|nr:hypothetical protein [Fererhizobium litorale]MDI7862863.1 hypothetical protein [Fererhizobium litorale]MDI7923949.1 hypothetical protein [Fererhizobium litorale]
MIGWFAIEAMRQDTRPPDLSVLIIGQGFRSRGYQAEFEVANIARKAAAGVVIRGHLIKEDRVLETVEATLDYVPMQSVARDGLIFHHDATGLDIQIAATGYSEP